jgi:squalene-hopene/tetraprenyl-beta-curcumene cyclase
MAARLILALALSGSALAVALEPGDVKGAADKAANFLVRQHNLGEGTFGRSKYARLPGVCGLAVVALCESPRQYREAVGPFVSQPVKYLLRCQRGDGAITIEGAGLDSYNTALAILALKSADNPAHGQAIARARQYLLRCQAQGGGFAYNHGLETAGDMSNTWTALEALEAAGLEKNSEVYRRALAFVRRCQDNAETNPDLAGTKNPGTGGGFYRPAAGAQQPAKGEGPPKPYGSMTAALIRSFKACGLTAEAPELRSALAWFRNNYSIQENPGMGMKGYFYYVWALSRALDSLGQKEVELADGRKAPWAGELAAKLISMQAKDGSFVNAAEQWMEQDPVLCTAYALQALSKCHQAMRK